MQQVKAFGILQTAKVSAVLYLILTAIFAVPFALIGTLVSLLTGKPQGLVALLFLLAPFLYAIVGALMVAFMCWVYNMIAARIGGIEIELQ